MARWKTLLLAGALGCWPALGYAQATLPVPPAAPGGDQGVPALPPGANTGAASVPVTVSGSNLMSPSSSVRPGRVTLSDMGGRGGALAGVPDITGMPKPEGGMVYTGMNGMMMQAGDNQASFIPAGANAFCAMPPVGVDPCGVTMQNKGPSGIVVDGGLSWLHTRRSDPSLLFRTVVNDGFGDVTVSQQEDYSQGTGLGWWAGAGYLTADGWFGMVTYRSYQDTLQDDTLFNDSIDPNFSFEYIGPGPLGSGAGGGDVPIGGSLTRFFDISWKNLDVMGGVVVSPARCVDVIFSGGLRISRLEQNYNVFINRGDGTTNAQTLFSRMEGLGPRFGMETRAYPLYPVSVYAKAYTSLLYANRLEDATATFTDEFGGTTGNAATFSRQEIMPILELGVGADVALFGGRVITGVGYDFNYLWEAGSTYTEQATNPRSARHVNLAIDGFNVHMTFLW